MNVSRDMRERPIRLCADYNARVRIVYVEVPEPDLVQQNQERSDGVPADTLVRLLDRWEMPDLTEAQRVEWVVRTAGDGKPMLL